MRTDTPRRGMMMLRPPALLALLSFTWTAVIALPCREMSGSLSPPVTVDRVRPADVSVLASVGLQEGSSELSTVASRLQELLSLFNPSLISRTSQRSSLMEQAQETALQLRLDQESWKLLVIFVQVDQLCACEQLQIQSMVSSAVSEVDDVLQLLHSQLKRTIVSIALWDGEEDAFHSGWCPCAARRPGGERRLLRATLTQALQESLDELLVRKHWHGDRDDFAVVLQATPLLRDPASLASGRRLSESQVSLDTDRLTVQLWKNLLQQASHEHEGDTNGKALSLPCPTEDRPFLRTEANSPSHHRGDASSQRQPLTGTQMPCEDLSPSQETPTSVHELRPGDIDVVAAVGDSLTAGNGIGSSPANILDVLNQYRGLSWSIGGDENLTSVTTVPNILKLFNQNVTGFSLGMGRQDTPQAFLNQAVAGAKSMDVPSQVRALVARMKNDSRINFETDWKLITLFIGGNDVCDHCYNSLLYSIESYAQNVRESLDYLHKEVPRALVNLVEPLQISPLREMHADASLKCPTWLVNILCPCVLLPKPDSKALQMVEDLNRGYQRLVSELVESGRYDTRPDFTVVVQPFLREIIVPKLPDGRPDRSFFSADCFHLSQKAQTVMARSLWNNMLEPLGSKTTQQNFHTNVSLKCPTKTVPYLRTYRNSNYTYAGPSPTPGPVTNWGSDFSCQVTSATNAVPTSVHSLRPADIKVVAALGDSITAGTGAKAKNVLQLSREYKGVSWSIGGDSKLDTVTTLPNILKMFNPSLKGFSKGQGSRQKGFNMAVPGAKTLELLAQTQALIKAMRESKEVNFEADWKLVTIFAGGNDLCHYCLDQNNLSPKNYSHHLMSSLDLLYQEVPRVLVNVVEILQMESLKSVKKNTLGCSLLQRSSCPCVINPSEISPELVEIKRINHEYQTEIQRLTSGDRYDGKDDFAVVLQPFLHDSFIPQVGEGETDTSFFSVDCFHISERAHAEMAIALWNNMLEPVGMKQAYNNFTYDRSKIHCPTEASPFIFTKLNSLPAPPPTESTTTTTTMGTTSPPSSPPSVLVCDSTVPVWVPAVVGVVCLLAGVAVTWVVLIQVQRRRSKQEKPVEMKGTGF